jgi:hypothetical protein
LLSHDYSFETDIGDAYIDIGREQMSSDTGLVFARLSAGLLPEATPMLTLPISSDDVVSVKIHIDAAHFEINTVFSTKSFSKERDD